MAGDGISSDEPASSAITELVKEILYPDVTKSLRKERVTCVLF
jgi:hypothetical protein